MAISKDVTVRDAGGIATYHRIITIELSHLPEPDVEGCKGSAIVRVAAYASADARAAGASPLAIQDARIRFGADIVDNWKGGPIAVMPVDEPTRADVYKALRAIPAYSDAIDA